MKENQAPNPTPHDEKHYVAPRPDFANEMQRKKTNQHTTHPAPIPRPDAQTGPGQHQKPWYMNDQLQASQRVPDLTLFGLVVLFMALLGSLSLVGSTDPTLFRGGDFSFLIKHYGMHGLVVLLSVIINLAVPRGLG